MAHWLLKSEPSAYSWEQLVRDGRTHWNGVRNHRAANSLKAMQRGEHAFFYHSNEGLAVVGIVEVVREYYPDPGDESGRFGMVDVAPVEALKTPVTLAQIKATPALKDLALIRQSRLSVMPIPDAAWGLIRRLGGMA
jgi:predicted RNA-binding protein with PUA-like domain